MKKALVPLILLLICLAIPAEAAIWFPEQDGVRLHRDPFCMDSSLFDGLYADAVEYATAQDASTDGRIICQTCYVEISQPVSPAEIYYFQPGGEAYLHTDPNCTAVSSGYPPLSGSVWWEDADWNQYKACPVCTVGHIAALPNACSAWNGTLEEKARLLPGIWTVPSEQAVSQDAALESARAFVQKNEEVMRRFPDGLFTSCLLHYDTGEKSSIQRETYRVVVTTPLREPVCQVYVDALTGETYLMIVTSDIHSSPQESDVSIDPTAEG